MADIRGLAEKLIGQFRLASEKSVPSFLVVRYNNQWISLVDRAISLQNLELRDIVSYRDFWII